jgi:hypothetical protein
MNSSGLSQPEKHRLLCAWLVGQLTADQASRLLAAAQADADLRREMADLQAIERLLRHQGVLSADEDLFRAEVITRLRARSQPDDGFASAVIDRLQHAPSRRRRKLRRPAVWAAALALLAAVSLAIAWLHSVPSTVATVAGLEAVQWGLGQSPLLLGQGMSRGTIEVQSGFVNLQFDSHANLILEGHARLELLGRNAARLHCGRVVAYVPDSAKGFVLESPEGRIIDLGTRFGVEVDDQGSTEVHVLQGLVRTAVRGESGTRDLHASQGLRLTPGNVMPIVADRTRFLTALPPHIAGPAGYVHWSFDEGKGKVAYDSGVGLGMGEATARLTSFSSDGQGPSWVAGRFGTALEFGGVDQHVVTDFRGIVGAQSRTVACWILVPRDWTPANAYAIVSWGAMHPGEAWQISINPDVKEGPVGRLRAGVMKGPVVGTRDLRDGQWHHIAVVLYDDATPRDSTHILLYVDGQLEPAYRKSIYEVRTAGERPDASNVMLGRDLSRSGRHVFRGTVDEVFIVNAAMSQESIQHLMSTNRLDKETP